MQPCTHHSQGGNGMSGTTAGDASGLDLDTHSRLGLAGLESCLFQSLVKLISVQQPAMHFLFKIGSQLLLFTRNHFSVWEAFLPKRFQTQEPFPLCSPSAFAWITVEQLGSSFSLLKQLLKRVLLHPSVNVAIQAHAIATCNHFESRISL